MPGSDDLLRIIDAPHEIGELEKVRLKMMEIMELMQKVSALAFSSKSTNGQADFRTQNQQQIEMMAKMKALEAEMDALRAKHATSNKARTDQEIADTQRKAQATRGRVADIRSEEDAYRRLTNEYNKAASAAKILAAQYGIHNKVAKEAAKEAKNLGEQISAINKATNNSSPHTGVGRYTEGIRDFAKELLVAGAAFFGIQKGVEFLKESLTEFGKAEVAMIRLKGILSNMGRANEIDSVKRSIKELSEQFKTIKPDEFTDVFQKLYTFGHLSTNMIRELIPVIANFASKQGIDVAEATSIMEKAMEGNSRALKEYGINMKEGKDETERFGIIMKELEPRVRDAEIMFEDTFPGALKKTQVEIEELKKDIGSDLVPVTKMFFELLKGEIGGLRIWADYISNLWKAIKGGGNIFDAFTSNPEDRRIEAEESDKRAKKLADYYLSLDKFKDKDKAKQEKLLSVYNSQLKVELQQYEVAKKNAELTGKNASTATPFDDFGKLLIAADKKAKAIAKFRLEQIATSKYMLQQANDIMTGDTVVNPGGPKGQTDEEIKREIEAQAKLYALRLQAAIDYQKVLADEKNNTIASRTEAYKKLIDLEREQVEGERDLKLKNTKLTEGERALIIYEAEEKMTKYQVENIGRLAQIRFDALNNDKILAAENAKELEDIERLHQKTMEDIRKAALVEQRNYLEDAKNIALAANDRDFLSGKISKTKYDKNNKKINYQFQKAALTDDKKANDAALALDPNNSELLKKQSKINYDLGQLELDQAQEIANKKKRLKQEEVDLAIGAAQTVESLVKGTYEKELNRIQKQIDKNNELKEKGNAAIQSSTLSLQEKAAAEILLNNKVQDSNEALQRKQRDIKVKAAKFDKAIAIEGIIQNAAVAAFKIIAEEGTIGLFEAAVLGGLAAEQIISIAARPIPTYKTGGTHKEDGPMIVHPGEIVVEPSGRAMLTPDAPQTLMYGKRNTRIIPAHEVNQEMLSGIMRAQVHEMRSDRTEELLTTLIEIGQNQTSAMKKKQVIHNHIHWNPGFNDHINQAVRN